MKEENKTEIYKDIIGYEGLYQISNFGNVKSLKWNKERILKLLDNRYGYLQVVLYKNNLSKLTNEQVLEIRKDNRVQKLIAKDYNVCQQTITDIKTRKMWNHI